ncbi:MAG: phosphatase PAP2 family protein [Candidatus Methanomethylicus sp.]|nr:phosphatase PAP2 family protein [Candidatus Methanomethylicus sp.]
MKEQKIPGYFSIIIGIIYTIYAVMENKVDDALLGILLVIPITLFIIFTWNKDWRSYRPMSAIIIILAILGPLLIVQTAKLFFGRVRFRDLYTDYSNFTPWYLPQGITGNNSFMSGHAAMSFIFLPLLISVRELRWSDFRKIMVVSLVIGWGLFVGASRIVVGAHYASDVLFSAGVDAVITILLYRKFYAK